VFVGRVVRVTAADGHRERTLVATFAVEKAWKGVRQPEIALTTPKGSSACGFDFEPGQRYLIYAYSLPQRSPSPRLATNICTRTRQMQAQMAADDVKKLGPPTYVRR
jgi:hypothetical protein